MTYALFRWGSIEHAAAVADKIAIEAISAASGGTGVDDAMNGYRNRHTQYKQALLSLFENPNNELEQSAIGVGLATNIIGSPNELVGTILLGLSLSVLGDLEDMFEK